ncbi:MAG: deoxyribose-phosphate aldolase [Myxococcales bacterium]|nr:deoxyribose-phosphate aldolase [Myxococcales bacterium]
MNSGAARVGAALDVGHVPSDIAKYIDHTLLKADATKEQLTRLCSEAKQFGFATVCVNPGNVRFCSEQLRGSSVKVCAVVGFPLGATTAAAKAFEARDAIRAGAREIDMVINIGALKSGDYDAVYEDIRKVVESSSPYKVKVILETGQLTDREKIVASTLSKLAKAAFVKTSTGFGPGGATVEDILLMKTVVGDKLEVKASGGVRTSEDAQRMIEAGATRIGASASVAIVTGAKGGAKSGY